ncbi:hypothetical protein ACFQ0B_19300 [Nonomuraea thailandensis]
MLIEMDRYFVLHAPRQTGKTTTLRMLASELTAEGDLAALMFSCERAKSAGDDYGAAESLLLDSSARPRNGRAGRRSCCRRLPGRRSRRAAGSVPR